MKIKYLFISLVIICHENYSGPKKVVRKTKQHAAKLDATEEHFSITIDRAEAHLSNSMKPMVGLFQFIKSNHADNFKQIVDLDRSSYDTSIKYGKQFLLNLDKIEKGLASGYFEKHDAKSHNVIMPEMRLLFLDRIKRLKSELGESIIQAEAQLA